MTPFRGVAIATAVIVTVVGGWGVLVLRASLPVLDGDVKMQGLQAPVTVTSDKQGIPSITADSRMDALRALGFVTAQDRLFQMDLLRRSSAGRLAEVLGESVVNMDLKQRTVGFMQVADAVMRRLPGEQRAALEAYAEGVNAFLAQMKGLPVECVLLGYRPAVWRPEDSLLVVLGMFQMLNGYDDDERMRTVMRSTFPDDVLAFLIPAIDPYTDMLLRGATSLAASSPIPVQSLATVRRPLDLNRPSQASMIISDNPVVGSNAWAVGGSRTADGRAILANDMHLDVAVPNIWYRVQLRYEDVDMAGMVVPGIPIMITGSNGYVAWGLTNVEGDFLDLVQVELNPRNAHEYATADGWRSFAIRRETIMVKGGDDRQLDVKETIWGPLAAEPLLGRSVAIRWTALDPDAVDVGLLYMDRVRSLQEAISVANRAAGPANNVLLADVNGDIAWTYTGRIPIRHGFDGSVSLSWADGRAGWSGFIEPDRLPRIVNPPSGFLVSANQRMVAGDYPYVIGHSFAGGYRAYRITERLRTMIPAREQDLFALQLDTTTEIYEFYRNLALQLLSKTVLQQNPHLSEIHHVLQMWSGKADVESRGFGLLVEFRKSLARSVFAPFLEMCREKDERFVYDGDLDTPLRALLTAQVPQLLPDQEHFADWHAFLLQVLEKSAEDLMGKYHVATLGELTWGTMNLVQMAHPLADALPGLRFLLNMPNEEVPGCGQCVRVASGSLTASQRLVVSPAHHGDGIFHMPGGQSGHPFSPHYRDQHPYWSKGISSPLLAGPATHRLTLTPVAVADVTAAAVHGGQGT
ncbi:MAG: penicillin acylase family protein [Nitrospirota bacterium]